MPIKDAITTVLNRNAYYRDGYRILLRVSLVQAAVILLLLVSITVMAISMKPRIVYFATTSDGRIINIVPLNEPYRTNAEIAAWTVDTARNVMRFGYNDYRERLQQVSEKFTAGGWDSFNKALKEANFIDAIQARKLVVMLDPNAAPEIQNEGERNGVYTWYVQFPVTIKFDGDQPPQAMSRMLRLQIVRVSTLQNPDGISIEQWVLSDLPVNGHQ
jgi:intracellular multiplication protein IcmL